MTDINEIYKSVLEADRAAVVICDLEHTIIYMNPVAIERYAKWGGKDLMGKSLLNCHNEKSREMIQKVVEYLFRNKMPFGDIILLNRYGKTLVINHKDIKSKAYARKIKGFL